MLVWVQGASGSASAGNREVFPAIFDRPLLVCSCHQVLESSRVGRVAGNGDINFFLLHDGDAFKHIIAAIDLDLGAVAIGIGFSRTV